MTTTARKSTKQEDHVKTEEHAGTAYLEHFLLASFGDGPLAFQLSFGLVLEASNFLRAEDASWLPHALNVTPAKHGPLP